MSKPQSLPWADPLAYAASIHQPYWALLYSGLRTGYSGRFSLLACDLAEHVRAEDFATLAPHLSSNRPRFENAWFGYFAYGLKHATETLPPDREAWPALPSLHFMRFNTVLEFDHETHTVTQHSLLPNRLPLHSTPLAEPHLPAVRSPLTSNMTREEYLAHAATILSKIHNGDFYQANLTRKFRGHFASPPSAFDLFRKLHATSPAAYSAFFKLDDTAILSSSPELFLKVDAQGHVRARPIKGTSPRHPNPVQDAAAKATLAQSPKDRAENLMIVDLMRNDLARTCVTGSIKVENLFEVTSHSHVHHMSSTITGSKRHNTTTLDVIAHAFPPGSMTGAPKLAAIRTLTELERDSRGIYSGALGWLGGDGSAELSVVIRTLLLQGDHFEFQVGGGIVADSTPEAELLEITDKSQGILKTLEISTIL